MKFYKKIGLGIGLALLAFTFLTVHSPHKAMALEPTTNADIVGLTQTLAFKDRGTITGKLDGTVIDFVDANIGDGNYNYKPPAGSFCSTGGSIDGITLNGDPFSGSASTITASVNLDITSDGTSGSCKDTTPNTIKNVTIGSPNNALIQFEWNNNDLLSIDGSTTLDHTGNASLFEKDTTNDCGGGEVLILKSGSTTQGTVYTGVNPLSGTQLVNSAFVNTKCFYTGSAAVTIIGTQGQPAAGGGAIVQQGDACTSGADCVNNVCQKTGGDCVVSSASSSDCVFSSNSGSWETGLNWILCPIVTGISASADEINGFVSGQLNFDVNSNLPAGGGVQKAWATFKDLASAVVVIIMLVMVISQAVGGGPFDAYTVRKMLPKLVAAVILMQLSWFICTFAIQLANDAGQGVAELLAAPFGGLSALELGPLLKNLGSVWAAIVGVGTTAGLITAIVFAGPILAFGWPVLLLGIILIMLAVIIALATLLFRNALIILLVMLSPLAFIAWVLPGTEKFWQMWKNNFVRVLVFFPLVMALIYGGRIFAWTVASLGGTAGPLDLLMVLVAFFAPYFLLPKAFKWAGPLMKSASEAISSSWPAKKGSEVVNRELLGAQKRKIGDRAKSLDPSKEGYASVSRKIGKVPIWGSGNIPRTMKENLLAGRVLPTKRGLAVAIKRGDTHSEEEDSIAAAQVKREKEKSITNGEMSYSLATDPETGNYTLDEDGNFMVKGTPKTETAGGKASLMKNMGSKNSRIAGAAIADAIATSSQVELMTTLVPVGVKNEDISGLVNDGAEVFKDTSGNQFVMAHELKRWNTKLNSTPELFGAAASKTPIAMPFIATSEPGKTSANMQATLQDEENKVAKVENRAPRTIPAPTPQEARAITVMRGYSDVDSIRGQSEAMLTEYGRLAEKNPVVANEYVKLLQRVGNGGQRGADILGAFASSDDATKAINKILSKAEVRAPDGSNLTINGLAAEAQARLRGPSVSVSPAPASAGSEIVSPTNAQAQQASSGGTPAGGISGVSGTESSGARNQSAGAEEAPQYVPQQTGPLELRIDHDALADTIRTAARTGIREGLRGRGATPDINIETQAPKPGDAITPGGVVLPADGVSRETREAAQQRPQAPPEDGNTNPPEAEA